MGEEYPFPARITTRVRSAERADGAEPALAARLGAAALARQLRRPRAQPAFTLLAEQPGGTLVGHALLAHERRRIGAATLEVGLLEVEASVDSVALLVGAAVAAAADAGLPLLALRGAPASYAALGLAPCALSSELRLPAPGMSAPQLRMASAADAADLAALADAGAAALPLAPARVAPDWRWLLEAPEAWLLLEDARGRAVAYASLDAQGRVAEAAAADAGGARQLVYALAAHGVQLLALQPGHAVARAALLLGGTMRLWAPRPAEPTWLWGVVDLALALAGLRDELARRLGGSRYAGWSGTLRLEGEAGLVRLRCAGGAVTVAAGAGPADLLVGGLGLAAAAQLLLGYRAAADLRATGELRCADVDFGLIDALFPVV